MNASVDQWARRIRVSIAAQRLWLEGPEGVMLEAAVSTAKNGAGERFGSECTPRGRHRVRAMIGAGCAENAVFRGRRPTGEIYSPELGAAHPERDWILTRILWLCGMEPGKNRFGDVDTMRRYIYIHGTPETNPMGVPLSHGCVRMHNADLLRLFEAVSPGAEVLIEE